jgi:hypothetical protein
MIQNHANTTHTKSQVDDQRILQLAHDTLDIEADAVRHLRNGLLVAQLTSQLEAV